MTHAFARMCKYKHPLVCIPLGVGQYIWPRYLCQGLAQEGLEHGKSLGGFVARPTWVIHHFLSVSPL